MTNPRQSCLTLAFYKNRLLVEFLHNSASLSYIGRGMAVYIRSTLRSKAKQRCVMGVGMCLYALPSLCKRKISSAKVQCYPHLSNFCSRPQLTQPYNHIILSWCCHGVLYNRLYICKGPEVSVWDQCNIPGAWGNQGEVPVSGLSGEFGSTCVVDGPNT